MSAPLDPIPESDPIADDDRIITGTWYRWLYLIITRLLTCILRAANGVHRAGVAGAIATTTLFVPSFIGTYRVTWGLQIVTPGTVSSSATVTIGWTTGGVAQTKVFPAITGNTTATNDSGTTTCRPDTGLPVTYAVAYATVGATPMAFSIDAVPEALT